MGILRLFLSISVIAAHSGTFVFSSHWIDVGYAVNLFFIISGFYMTMILSGKYKAINPIFFMKTECLDCFLCIVLGYYWLYSFHIMIFSLSSSHSLSAQKYSLLHRICSFLCKPSHTFFAGKI